MYHMYTCTFQSTWGCGCKMGAGRLLASVLAFATVEMFQVRLGASVLSSEAPCGMPVSWKHHRNSVGWSADPRSLFLGMGSALLPPRLGELGAAGATNLQLWRRPWCIGSGLVCWGEQKSKYSHCHHICIQQKHTGQPWPLFALALTLRCLRQRGVRCRIATKDPAVSTAG